MSLQNQTIFWSALPSGEGWDGFSLLVDDVERYVGVALNYSLASLQLDIPHFFRIAVRSILDLPCAFELTGASVGSLQIPGQWGTIRCLRLYGQTGRGQILSPALHEQSTVGIFIGFGHIVVLRYNVAVDNWRMCDHVPLPTIAVSAKESEGSSLYVAHPTALRTSFLVVCRSEHCLSYHNQHRSTFCLYI